MSFDPAVVFLGVFAALLVYAAVSDLLTYTIPNRVGLALVAAFALFAPLAGMGMADFGMHLAAGAVILLAGFAMFALRWIGGGDAKLAAAVCLWFGFGDLLSYLAVAALAGGLLTIAILALRALPMPIVVGNWVWLTRVQDKRSGVPYGIALAAGALFVLPQTKIWMLVFGI